jgi:hypothetical protein
MPFKINVIKICAFNVSFAEWAKSSRLQANTIVSYHDGRFVFVIRRLVMQAKVRPFAQSGRQDLIDNSPSP